MSWSLKRTKQCAKCPWIQGSDPHEIPNGYCETKHRGLSKTIARGGALEQLGRSNQRAMACHETDDAHCVGWLVNQVGPGNNIAMRMRLIDCDNADKIELRGEQHERFEDTLPQ